MPVKLAEFVANVFIAYIDEDVEKDGAGSGWLMEGFEEWLVGEKEYSGRSAKDVVSRCRRSERILRCVDWMLIMYFCCNSKRNTRSFLAQLNLK